jgi:hypothetical protein
MGTGMVCFHKHARLLPVYVVVELVAASTDTSLNLLKRGALRKLAQPCAHAVVATVISVDVICADLTCCAVLCSQVLHPVEYAKVVSRIGNEMDLTQVRKK